ncbi:hypothetical protein M9458_039239, partial [Cirrhinus mrigala]
MSADRGGAAGGRPDPRDGRGPARARLAALLPVPAAAHHPRRRLLPAHPALHGERRHHPDLRGGGDALELLLHGRGAVRRLPPGGRPSGVRQSAVLPAVRLHRVGRGSGGRSRRLRGDSHQRAAAHPGVRRVSAERRRDRGERPGRACGLSLRSDIAICWRDMQNTALLFCFACFEGGRCFCPVSLVRGVRARGRGDGGRRVSGRGVFFRGGAGRSDGGRRVRSAGGFHLALHVAHACDRAPLRLPVQLHGVPVGRGLPPVRHHG